MKNVELRFYELFDIVTKTFDDVEQAWLYYRKNRKSRHANGKKNKEHVADCNWFGGEYRFKEDRGWSDWYKID